MSDAEAIVTAAPVEVKPEQQPMETDSTASAAPPQPQQASGDKQSVGNIFLFLLSQLSMSTEIALCVVFFFLLAFVIKRIELVGRISKEQANSFQCLTN